MIYCVYSSGSLYDQKKFSSFRGFIRWPQSAREMKEIARRCGKEPIYQAIEAVEEARQDLERNINTGYALKGMLLR